MSDLFLRTQAEFQRSRTEFLHLELANSSRTIERAENDWRRNCRGANETIREAELAYASVLQSLTDPENARRLTIKSKQELTVKLNSLRAKLDKLHGQD